MSSSKEKRPSSSKSNPTVLQVPPPQHVAIIMDGNGRWAESRSKTRVQGHLRGTKAIRPIMETAKELGVNILTLWAFSVDNWKRPQEEVSFLMHLLDQYLKKERNHFLSNKIRLRVTGRISELPQKTIREIQSLIEATKEFKEFTLNIALSYGGREELIDAIRTIAQEAREGKIIPDSIDSRLIQGYLYTADIPNPDLIIRTGGEFRLSNFFLWQSAYSEFFFTPTYWPDFSPDEFRQALLEFQNRERRFGLTGKQPRKQLSNEAHS